MKEDGGEKAEVSVDGSPSFQNLEKRTRARQ